MNCQVAHHSNEFIETLKSFSEQTLEEGLLVNLVTNIEYNSLEDSFSTVKIRAPLIRPWSWVRRLLTLPRFWLILLSSTCVEYYVSVVTTQNKFHLLNCVQA